tara:strand:- start:3309 stop:3713 length:405 start_codon:yes stop_codon:yes gene_type:complete
LPGREFDRVHEAGAVPVRSGLIDVHVVHHGRLILGSHAIESSLAATAAETNLGPIPFTAGSVLPNGSSRDGADAIHGSKACLLGGAWAGRAAGAWIAFAYICCLGRLATTEQCKGGDEEACAENTIHGSGSWNE